MRFRLILIAAIFFAGPAVADFSDWTNSEHIMARIVAEDDKFGVEMEVDPGWHTYYKVPGDAGIATSFSWHGSSDIKVKEVVFPPSKVFDENEMKTNVYEGNVFFPVKADLGAKPHIELNIRGAVCKDICIPYSISIQKDLPPNSSAKENISGSYLAILWTAFLAGLILNIMPCVLPVLSLKVLGVLKASGVEKKRARYNFLSTSLGIIFSFWVLAAIAIGLKTAGMAIGWGLHFQSPVFVGALLVIILLFAFSLFGFFHMRPPSWISGTGSHNLIGSFFSGMLATLLGTSCTAPLLVTAVGFALSGNSADIFLIFTIMGIGMAVPFLLFALRPQIATFLPKPGAWMAKVKFAMGVLLLVTAAWLGFVLYELLTPEPQAQTQDINGTQWQVFDEAKMADYVSEGKTVFVDITASWCVNCQVNKKAVLDTDEMGEFFKEEGIILMQGDMTRPNRELINYIKKYNRYGIPFNMVYGPSARDGILLPTLLTKHAVKQAIGKAAGKE